MTEPEHTGEQKSKSMFGFEIWKGYRRYQQILHQQRKSNPKKVQSQGHKKGQGVSYLLHSQTLPKVVAESVQIKHNPESRKSGLGTTLAN